MKMRITGMAMMAALLAACGQAPEKTGGTAPAAAPAPTTEAPAATATVVEKEPSIEDGVDPESLGLFSGPALSEEGEVPMPAQIVLFLDNIWDYAEGDREAFREEVRTTLLHELGHYLGLEEDELIRGVVAFRPKNFTPRRLSDLCLDFRKKFYSYLAIFRRGSNIRGNCNNIFKIMTFYSLNILARKEAEQRQGLLLGKR